MLSVEFCGDLGRTISVGHNRFGGYGRVRPAPKGCGNREGVDPLVLPPGALVAAPVKFTVVQPADGNGEAVADLPSHRALLCKLDVVGIRRGSAADEAGLRSHKPQVFAVALTHRFTDDGDCLLARIDLQWLVREGCSPPDVWVRSAQIPPTGSA